MSNQGYLMKAAIRVFSATLFAFVSCSSPSPTSSSAPPSSSIEGTTTVPATTAVAVSVAPGALAPEPIDDPIPVAVKGTPLPSAVTSRYEDGGGQLLVTGLLWEQLAVRALPYPAAPGAYLTDAESSVELVEPGVVSRDEGFGWLFEDDRPLGEILDEFANAVGITADGWAREVDESVRSGADCVERHYTNPTRAVAWSLSGCSYPQFSGMRAVQVRRAGRYATSGLQAPPILSAADSTTLAVTDEMGASVSGWSVVVSQPDASGSTMSLSIMFDLPSGADESVVRSVLSGWTERPANEARGVSWESGNDRWELNDGVLSFHRAGRVSQ